MSIKELNLKAVSLQTLLGGIAVYVTAKQTGADEKTAILAGVVSALTSGGASVVDTKKKAKRLRG